MGDPGEAASVSPPCSKRRRKNAPRCIDCGQNAFPPTCICLERFTHRMHGVAAGTKVFFHFVSGERLWPGMWRQGLPGRLSFQDIQHEKWHRERDSVPVEYVLPAGHEFCFVYDVEVDGNQDALQIPFGMRCAPDYPFGMFGTEVLVEVRLRVMNTVDIVHLPDLDGVRTPASPPARLSGELCSESAASSH